MNAAIETSGVPTARHISPVEKFKTLLRREYWENRGGFFWAPVIAGGVTLLLGGIISLISLTLTHKIRNSVDGDFSQMESQMHTREAAAAFGYAGDTSLLAGIGIAFLVMIFVQFFYCLGALYDERKDRSVLFWKSLPVSDTQTVMSKLAWTLLLAPLLTIGIGIVIGIAHWILGAATLALNGLPGSLSMFTQAHPFRVVASVLSLLPVYACWSLPTVGWLMFCSAWARSVPFLWAVLVPVIGGAIISTMEMLPNVSIPHATLWYVIGRGLLSVVPMTWYANGTVRHSLTEQLQDMDQISTPDKLAQHMHFGSSWSAFATADMWIGIAVGVAFIVAAIRLRRWRDEG